MRTYEYGTVVTPLDRVKLREMLCSVGKERWRVIDRLSADDAEHHTFLIERAHGCDDDGIIINTTIPDLQMDERCMIQPQPVDAIARDSFQPPGTPAGMEYDASTMRLRKTAGSSEN